MKDMTLTRVDVRDLNVFINNCDLRRDLHIFIDYVRGREVKRSHRSNNLPKTDALRLAKIMTDPEAYEEVKDSGYSVWVDYIDRLTLKLGLVKYDTEGEYLGYTSTEPSYPNNYLEFKSQAYREFLQSSLQNQEEVIRKTLIKSYGCERNEFYGGRVLGQLDGFDYSGCATGVMPTLDFARIRRFLLNILTNCESGQWYSTPSLIKYLKKSHPFFLIPEKFRVKDKWDKKERYGNFREYKGGDRWSGKEIPITEKDSDAFERVEGRYVERFLEGIPLVMGYLDVAYDRKENKTDISPSLNKLLAFRIRKRFLQAMSGKISEPKVTVQPNFEIQVESEFYPARVMSQLKPLAEVITEDRVIVLKLQKEKVANELVRDETLKVIPLLKNLNGRELPENIVLELEEWSGHSETFTLYEGLGLLEGDQDLPEVDRWTVEKVSSGMRFVRSPGELFRHLENKELVPLKVRHANSSLHSLPREVRTVFAKKLRLAKTGEKKKITLKRETIIVLYFPAPELYEKFRKKLLEAKCSFQSDKKRGTITFSEVCEPEIMNVIAALKDDYLIKFEELE